MSFVNPAAVNATLTSIQLSSVPILKELLITYYYVAYTCLFTFNEIIANTYIIFLNFILH